MGLQQVSCPFSAPVPRDPVNFRLPKPRLFLSAAALLAGSAFPALAQTGPLLNGELIFCKGDPAAPGQSAIYRVDPNSGQTVLWADKFFPQNTQGGWAAFDPFRNRLLAAVGYFPMNPQTRRLYSIAPDGTVQSLGQQDDFLKAFAPVGDGRVYCFRNQELALLTADDEMVPVLDQGGQPFDIDLGHMAYHAPTNSLVGVASLQFDASCFAIWTLQVLRLPLTADGTQLAGPVACATVVNGLTTPYPMGIQPLPSGQYLVPLSNASSQTPNTMLQVDPFTLASSVWSNSDPKSINGGAYVPSLNRVVIQIDTGPEDELRSFAMGQGGAGDVLATSLAIGDPSSGTSMWNRMLGIDWQGGGCSGFAQAFGIGLAGTAGAVPKLHIGGCPRIGGTLEFDVWDALGQTAGVAALSAASAPLPIFGGTGYLLPPLLIQKPFVTDGAAGAGGSGSGSATQALPANPALIGLGLFAQAGLLDAGAPLGVSLTNAVEITLGS